MVIWEEPGKKQIKSNLRSHLRIRLELLRNIAINLAQHRPVFLNRRAAANTGPWHQLYRAARGSPGICHFSFLSNFHEQIFYNGTILRRKIFANVSKNSDPDVGLRKLQYATRFH